MKNIKQVEAAVQYKDVIQSITCNKCGETFEPDEENEFLHIHHTRVDFDGEYNNYKSKCWWFDLCDSCLINFIKTFKFAPDWFQGNYGASTQSNFEKWVNEGCKHTDPFDVQ